MTEDTAGAEAPLKVQRDGHIVVLTMNNPRRRNALSPRMITMLAEAWDEIDGDDGIRVAILTGEGDAYCAGGDMADGWMVYTPSERGDGRSEPTGSVMTDGLLLTRTLTTPLIAAVNGPCLGGGCEMLQQNDIRIAEEQVVFGATRGEVRFDRRCRFHGPSERADPLHEGHRDGPHR